MRRSAIIFLLIALSILLFLLHEVSTLIGLLFEDASRDAIQKSELPAPNSTLLSSRPQVIPRIIHQTYINESIPQRWVAAQKSCIDLHPDYEYNLWTDADSLAFITKEYPWFLNTFVNYKHPIQRADSIRYFVLAHYGGVYIDLDVGCKRRLDPLLSYTAFLHRTIPTGISNDVMGSVPQHPFFLRVLESLQGANRKWLLPYITIMASTGPLFLSVIWKKWMNEHSDLLQDGSADEWKGRVRVLMPDEYKMHSWSFFNIYTGSSWHGNDAKFIFWMGRNWLLLTAGGTVVVLSLGLCLWWMYGRVLLLGKQRGLAAGGNGVPKPAGRHASRSSPGRRPTKQMSPFWRRLTGMERKSQSYELVGQHDA